MNRRQNPGPRKRTTPAVAPPVALNETFVSDANDASRLTSGTRRYSRRAEAEMCVDEECCPGCGEITGDGEPCSFCAEEETEDE